MLATNINIEEVSIRIMSNQHAQQTWLVLRSVYNKVLNKTFHGMLMHEAIPACAGPVQQLLQRLQARLVCFLT